jgi:hypothetical protein
MATGTGTGLALALALMSDVTAYDYGYYVRTTVLREIDVGYATHLACCHHDTGLPKAQGTVEPDRPASLVFFVYFCLL